RVFDPARARRYGVQLDLAAAAAGAPQPAPHILDRQPGSEAIEKRFAVQPRRVAACLAVRDQPVAVADLLDPGYDNGLALRCLGHARIEEHSENDSKRAAHEGLRLRSGPRVLDGAKRSV